VSDPEGLAQFENMIRRDRNHPSVFIGSMGNEESISPTETGLRLLTSMKRVGLKDDASRPIGIAPPPAGDYIGRGRLAIWDVMGYNYADPQAEDYHKANPTVPILNTENVSAVGTRGAYVTDRAKGTVSSYDRYTTTGRAFAEGWWRFVSARPYISGAFVWTGFDYRGEPSPYQRPNISSQGPRSVRPQVPRRSWFCGGTGTRSRPTARTPPSAQWRFGMPRVILR
jgi:beta-galactosidase